MEKISKILDGMQEQMLPSPDSRKSKEVVVYEPMPAVYQQPASMSKVIERHYEHTEILKAECLSLRGHVKKYGIAQTKIAITMMIAYLEDMLAKDSRMSEQQVVEAVNCILYQYPYISLEELLFVFRRIWQGAEGTIYLQLRIEAINRALMKNKERRRAYYEDGGF